MFQENNILLFNGKASQFVNSTDERKLEYVIERHQTLNRFYTVLSMLCVVCIRKQIPLIIENPYTQPHYLNLYWCIEPTLIDKDRRKNGDYFQKPTQYWFINCEPKHNFIFEPITHKETKIVNKIKGADRQRERSMIASEYANRFIRQFILDEGRNGISTEQGKATTNSEIQ